MMPSTNGTNGANGHTNGRHANPTLDEIRERAEQVRSEREPGAKVADAQPPRENVTLEPEDLTTMEQDILRVATSLPQSAKVLARLAEKTMGTHVNAALTSLCRKHMMVRLPDGYVLGNRNLELPAIEQAVLRVCTVQPQTSKKLARLAGYSESRVREAIARLTGTTPPQLIRVNGGVRLPDGYSLESETVGALEARELDGLVKQLRALRAVLVEVEALREVLTMPVKVIRDVSNLGAIEQAIMKVVSETPMTTRKIARLAAYSEGRVSESLTLLSSLDPPLVVRVKEGYRVPGADWGQAAAEKKGE